MRDEAFTGAQPSACVWDHMRDPAAESSPSSIPDPQKP